MVGFLDLQSYTRVDELEDAFMGDVVDDDMFLVVREILSWEEFSVGVTESSIIVANRFTKIYVQRERLIDLAEWMDEFPIIGMIIDEITSRIKDYELLISVLIDNTVARPLFESGKTYQDVKELVDDIPVRSVLDTCTCCNECDDGYKIALNIPSYLLKAINLAKLEYEPSLCEDGRIGVKLIYPDKSSSCYTVQKPISIYQFR